jgi:copper resistance protein B
MRGPLLLAAACAAFQGEPAAAQSNDAAWSMADGAYGAERMAQVRRALVKEHGGMAHWFVLADRLEYQSGDAALADIEAWYGTDEHRLKLKAETAYDFAADAFEEAEISALYAKPIAPFWDAEIGLRVDAAGENSRNWAVLGVEGLAPYFFHMDAVLLVSFHGEVAAEIEGSTDVLLTQRLILQPRAELTFAAQDIPEIEFGSGLASAELGLRLRYEISRTFAPYVGLSWERKVGRTADFARAAGEDPGGAAFVAGVRLWF